MSSSQQQNRSSTVHQPSRRVSIMNPSLMKLKLLEVLRNGDTPKLLEFIHQIDTESTNYDLLKLKNELLLYAVQVGPLSINKFIVETNLVDINAQDSDGNTALHLAAISNRNDIIEYLMNLPDINDCVYNLEMKQPIQCTTNMETVQLMEYLRDKHIEQIASKLRHGFETRNFELLDKLLNNPRDKELLDINGTDPLTGDTVLIEFVKKHDYDMVKFILDHGGDPFKRSVSGKLPEESTTDPEMKKIIEDSFAKQNIMESTSHPQDGSPTCKGFLKKWTNFAGGYKLRWFVLDNEARLSYYKSPNDMNNTCRGLIHLAHAMLKVDSSENTKFEIIIQNPSDGSPVRWHLKAEHSTEAQKWIWILQNAIRYAKDTLKSQRKSSVIPPNILTEDLSKTSSDFTTHARSPSTVHVQSSLKPLTETREELQFHPSADISNIPDSNSLKEDRKSISSLISYNNKASPEAQTHTSSGFALPPSLNNAKKLSTEIENEIENENVIEINNNDEDDNDNDDNDDISSVHSFHTEDIQNTNISPRVSFDSLRNQVGPVPDRVSQYNGNKQQHLNEATEYNVNNNQHNRAPSVASAKSGSSERSEHSKNSLAKKLYKKPLKQLGKLGRKTRDSFVVDPEHAHKHRHSKSSAALTALAEQNGSRVSVASNSSAASSHVYGSKVGLDSEFEGIDVVDDDDDDDEDEAEDDEDEYNDSHNTVNGRGGATDLHVVRNQITIQMKTFKDFLDSAVYDQSIGKDDLAQMSSSILATLNILINQEGASINHKYNELVRRLEKQQKISSIWENSIKQLELEIQERESKIVELEDKLKALKKALRNSVIQMQQQQANNTPNNHRESVASEQSPVSNATSAAALARQALTANMAKNVPPIPTSAPPFDAIKQQQEEERALQRQREIQQKFQTSKTIPLPIETTEMEKDSSFAAQPTPFDPTLTQFIQESDSSDDEFFDAEESDVVKDMSVLERRETMRTRKNKQHKEVPQQAETEASFSPRHASTVPAIPTELPPPIPQRSGTETEEEMESLQPSHVANPESNSPDELSMQPSEDTAVTSEINEKKVSKISNPNFKPELDSTGHFVVNQRELLSNTQITRYNNILGDQSFEGYEDPLRLSLAPEDNRPKMSLWGVLKSLVGKDMTKMTLPVTFNEPTSLLQRNVEVIEYSDLLDKAAAIEASTLRLVYVATFAASEYASTVGRIAKPFNPLLGETFEYSRPDKGYRCFVEQVSHHPPISALVAESPRWSYYGESNVKTKFLGRSFDIKHLGTWFCEIYPDAGVECKDGKKTDKEVYSWKKVNNSVIGIIVGNPTIDNYGDMEIHNHMTGDYMKFNFKPRGWRASSAYEVKGEVFNAKGKLMYYVGGHWNSKIFCKPADDKNAERFLVWEAAPRQEMMFHLTNFAATLNAPQPHLLPKVACTDTRLRPDQRAMENGDYDLAAEEKNRVEEKQREVRRQREMKGEEYKPTFFVKDHHPVTREEYWRYEGAYWRERMEGKLKDYKDIF